MMLMSTSVCHVALWTDTTVGIDVNVDRWIISMPLFRYNGPVVSVALPHR